jgi:hypothetical protein
VVSPRLKTIHQAKSHEAEAVLLAHSGQAAQPMDPVRLAGGITPYHESALFAACTALYWYHVYGGTSVVWVS